MNTQKSLPQVAIDIVIHKAVKSECVNISAAELAAQSCISAVIFVILS